MKTMTLEELAQRVPERIAQAQQDNILITRDGDPVAVLLGIENKDEEDWSYQISPEFWKMIAERRREVGGIPLEQVKAELLNGQELIPRYSMIIQWSDEDQVYVVTLPEFGGCKTHGETYEEAAIKGEEALVSLMEAHLADGKPLPEPAKLGSVPA
jgi:predicted RNase H-like HicB family nuclease/antitoxin (DNA-binding transcriptional repressor) of toxin-antitoxin stability system